MDIFIKKNVLPMLIAENNVPFDNSEYIYELKLDGIRCLAYLSDTECELRNKRNKRLNAIYPELSEINKQVKNRCILDGELVALINGKPDFYEVQRRSLMSNPFMIEMASKKIPVSFTAFDIIYYDDKQITDLPLIERKKILFDIVTETPKLALSRYIETKGIAYFKIAKQQGLEGIVAKHIDSKYYFGKRTKDWIKIKALHDEDFIICGYFAKEQGITSLILGSYKNESLVYQSHVAMGVSRNDFKIISSQKRVPKNFYCDFPEFIDSIWIEPELVCTVQYMEKTPHGGLRQPVFKGLRDDKIPKECFVR